MKALKLHYLVAVLLVVTGMNTASAQRYGETNRASSLAQSVAPRFSEPSFGHFEGEVTEVVMGVIAVDGIPVGEWDQHLKQSKMSETWQEQRDNLLTLHSRIMQQFNQQNMNSMHFNELIKEQS